MGTGRRQEGEGVEEGGGEKEVVAARKGRRCREIKELLKQRSFVESS